MKDLLKDIRPHLIHYIHDKKVEAYKNHYMLLHGKEPSAEFINEFINTMIQNETIIHAYDELVIELENQIYEKRLSKTQKLVTWIFSDSTLTLLILAVCLQMILLYVSSKMKEPWFDVKSLINETSFISAIALLLIAFGHMVRKK